MFILMNSSKGIFMYEHMINHGTSGGSQHGISQDYHRTGQISVLEGGK